MIRSKEMNEKQQELKTQRKYILNYKTKVLQNKTSLTKGYVCVVVVLDVWMDRSWRKDKFNSQS